MISYHGEVLTVALLARAPAQALPRWLIRLFWAACLTAGCSSSDDGSLAPTSPGGSGAVWVPAPGTTWQWQLDGTIDQSVNAGVFDIDLFDSDASVVAALHARGRKVIAYLSAGSWEDWRPDAGAFPQHVLGREYEGWAGERWLDIRRIDLLAPIMRARLDLCRDKGFDGVEPDNVDGYANNTGFPISYQDQLDYNRWLAAEAHARGLAVGLKNDPDQAAALLGEFDWAMTEDCFAEGWCGQVASFVGAGKAVFAAEYDDTGMTLSRLCPQAEAVGFSAILKRRGLGAWRQSCGAGTENALLRAAAAGSGEPGIGRGGREKPRARARLEHAERHVGEPPRPAGDASAGQ